VCDGTFFMLVQKSKEVQVAKTFDELINEAKEAEKNEDFESAAKYYERAIKSQPHNEAPYTRAMIMYRKLAEYESELKIINKGINIFEEFYQNRSQKVIGNDKKVVQLSNALAKSLGLKDRKGKDQFHPEPIAKWMKRKEVVLKKLGR
jgi:tetratricopeptide (TPR) repeat protein